MVATMPVDGRTEEIRQEFLRRVATSHAQHAALTVVAGRAQLAERAVRSAAMPEPERAALLGHLHAIDAAARDLAGRLATAEAT